MFRMIRDFLYYVTNNEKESRHEEFFDVLFLVINTAALVGGIVILVMLGEIGWIAFLVIEYNWALDNMRHNRP
jgi:hypothetical protein